MEKFNLKDFTTEELLDEIKRREDLPVKPQDVLCVGIVDNDGAESLLVVKNAEDLGTKLSSLQLRARFNTQRHPIVYSVKIPLELFDKLDNNMKKGNYHEASEAIQSFSTFKNLGY